MRSEGLFSEIAELGEWVLIDHGDLVILIDAHALVLDINRP